MEILQERETAISDYCEEYKDRGRIGLSAVDLDRLEFLGRNVDSGGVFEVWDKIVIFPGCIVSSRFPGIVLELYQLLVLLGVQQDRIIVEDNLCCGSFLRHASLEEFTEYGLHTLATLLHHGQNLLVLTACGSCTSALSELLESGKGDAAFAKHNVKDKQVEIMHYIELLANPSVAPTLGNVLESKDEKNCVYFQFPCQAKAGDGNARRTITRQVEMLLEKMGNTVKVLHDDLGCCGAAVLDMLPEAAIEYGIKRLENITMTDPPVVDTILIACGNCYRMYSDFRPSIEVEGGNFDSEGPSVRFLIDLLIDRLR
jgi:Fe-S oxidoreductase